MAHQSKWAQITFDEIALNQLLNDRLRVIVGFVLAQRDCIELCVHFGGVSKAVLMF